MATTRVRMEKVHNKTDHAGAQSFNLFAWLEQLSSGKVMLLISLFVCLAYSNSIGGDFVFDDAEQIVENPDIRSWENLTKAFKTHVWAFRERADVLRIPTPPPYYRPVFTVVLTAGYHVFGLWPQGWHLLCLLLHTLCSIGVFYVLLQASRNKPVAVISALLFAVFPVHAESVSWISGMTDPLFGVFFLASLYCYLQYRTNKRRGLFALSLLMFALSAFSKETALSLVAVVFAYGFIESASTKKATIIESVVKGVRCAMPFFIVTLFYLIPRYLVLGGLTWQNPHAHKGPFIDTLITLPSVLASYFSHLVWPVGLSVAYNTSFVTTAGSFKFLVPAALLALVAIALIMFRRHLSRGACQALVLILIPLLPVLDLRQLSEEYLVSDRYLYLSVAGWCYLIALGLSKLAGLSNSAIVTESSKAKTSNPYLKLASAVAVLLMISLTAVAARENLPWSGSYSLWANVTRVRPGFWAAHYNTGLVLIESKRPEQALIALRRAAELAPQEPRVFDALGRTYDALGDTGNAINSFNTALEIDPGMFESFNNLGAVYFKKGDYATAQRQFASALALKPQLVDSRFNLSLCMARRGRYSEAERELEQVLRVTQNDAEVYYELGLVYEQTGKHSEARTAFQRCLELSKSQELVEKARHSLSQIQKQAQS